MNNIDQKRASNRISGAFSDGKTFIGFVTAGDPTMAKTEEFIMTMIESGADLIEIGIPFSDPVAEGAVIQRANARALSAGATTEKIFEMVARLRKKTEIPLVFLIYINPIHSYGYELFTKRCRETGVDGLIIPDLPYEEKRELLKYTAAQDIELISLIAPTSEDRITMIAKEAQGFIYCVSSMGVTGVRSKIEADIQGMIQKVREVTKLPVAIGFGISTPEQASEICGMADGVIVGSAMVKIIEKYGEEASPYLCDYVAAMKQAIL